VARRHHAGVAEETPRAVLDREPAEAMPREGGDITIELGVARGARQGTTEIVGDLRIGVQGGEGVAVLGTPASQGQAGRPEAQAHRALPNRNW
jgi:hypothetical protein